MKVSKMNDISKKSYYESLEALRFPLIVMVLFIHTSSPDIKPVTLSWDAGSVYTLLKELISHNIGRVVVPAFFVLSGYFYFLKVNRWGFDIYRTQLTKRIPSIFLPYFLWNALMVLIILLKNYALMKFFNTGYDDNYEKIETSSVYDLFWSGPINFTLWYIRDLMVMVILSPLFYWLICYLKWGAVVLFLILYLWVVEIPVPGFSTTAFFYFCLGAFFGLKKYNVVTFSSKIGVWILIVYGGLLCLATTFNGKIGYEYAIRAATIIGVISLFYLAGKLDFIPRFKRLFIHLSSTVFFIYCVHEIYIRNWATGLWARTPLPETYWKGILGFWVVPIWCLLFCLLLYWLFHRFSPRVLGVLTGGRDRN